MFAEENSLTQLVREDYRTAAVLHRFGIDFYRKPHHTLKQACEERKLKLSIIQGALDTATKKPAVAAGVEELRELSAVQIMQYLKIQHRNFIFRKLPYMQRLIADSEAIAEESGCQEVLEDLRLAFPLFAEDFARHIFEEEEEMFTYIELLHNVLFKGEHFSKTFMRMERATISEFLIAHHAEDDDMSGIRNITKGYCLTPHAHLLVRVLYAELQAFEQQLTMHARIENRLLLPKALKLEAGVKWLMERKRELN